MFLKDNNKHTFFVLCYFYQLCLTIKNVSTLIALDKLMLKPSTLLNSDLLYQMIMSTDDFIHVV